MASERDEEALEDPRQSAGFGCPDVAGAAHPVTMERVGDGVLEALEAGQTLTVKSRRDLNRDGIEDIIAQVEASCHEESCTFVVLLGCGQDHHVEVLRVEGRQSVTVAETVTRAAGGVWSDLLVKRPEEELLPDDWRAEKYVFYEGRYRAKRGLQRSAPSRRGKNGAISRPGYDAGIGSSTPSSGGSSSSR